MSSEEIILKHLYAGLNYENTALLAYNGIIKDINDSRVKEDLQKIIEDEKKHIEIFKALIEKLKSMTKK